MFHFWNCIMFRLFLFISSHLSCVWALIEGVYVLDLLLVHAYHLFEKMSQWNFCQTFFCIIDLICTHVICYMCFLLHRFAFQLVCILCIFHTHSWRWGFRLSTVVGIDVAFRHMGFWCAFRKVLSPLHDSWVIDLVCLCWIEQILLVYHIKAGSNQRSNLIGGHILPPATFLITFFKFNFIFF